MRLSEAIRIGAKLRPQTTAGEYIEPHGGSCALGAAYEAIADGDDVLEDVCDDELEEAFPILRDSEPSVACPSCANTVHMSPMGLIVHLNDTHKWTREQIADWVETSLESAGADPAVVTQSADHHEPTTRE